MQRGKGGRRNGHKRGVIRRRPQGKERGGRAGETGGVKTGTSKQPLYSMLYTENAGVVSWSSEDLGKMMAAIVKTCKAFGLAVSTPAAQVINLEQARRININKEADLTPEINC